MKNRLLVLFAVLCLFSFSLFPSPLSAEAKHDHSLSRLFTQAAKEFDVPVEILLAISYAETRWMDHQGEPSQLNGYGLMHLAENPANDSLVQASRLLGLDKTSLMRDRAANIRGAAAVLRELAKEQNEGVVPANLANWYTTVAHYSGLSSKLTQKWYADDVYRFINQGVSRVVDGKEVKLSPTPVIPERGDYAQLDPIGQATPDYPGARWVAASSSNYTVANRESDGNAINYIIIHTTQGSYAGTISWFQNASAQVSAHYVIRSSDGQITQMVQNKDIAWHAGNWDYNVHSIGIEHEGYVSDPAWYTDAMYRASANLTRWLCDTYGIPKDLNHIIGHHQVPGATHTDPGPNWDWNYYMSLVNQSGDSTQTIVDNSTSNRFTASGNWAVGTTNAQKYGTDYRYANPEAISDPAWYKVNVPATGNYDVYAWWPSGSTYNNNTPYVIQTSSGNQSVYVSQRSSGGIWNHLGTFHLAAGDANVIGVSRWTSGTGYVIADAVRIVRR